MDIKLNSTGSLSCENITVDSEKKIDAVIYYSYATPVGYQILDQGMVRKTVIVNHKYSKTTSKHLNQLEALLIKNNGILRLGIESFIQDGLKDGINLRVGFNVNELNKVI